jgi:enterochelin esterase-like enzyme
MLIKINNSGIMQKNIKILFFLVLIISFKSKVIVAESRGEVKLSRQFKSEILDTMVRYSIYLPANYSNTDVKYPVLYLLHGFTDDETIWYKNGWIDQAADQGIISGKIKAMIIVMPDAGLKWYLNQPKGDYNYEDMFIKELIPFIEKTYRIKSEKKYRSIGGLSMGGFGALGYSMRHPELFATCIAYSAGLFPDNEIISYPQEEYDTYFSPLYGKGIHGKDRLSKHWNKNNPLYLAKKVSVEKLKSVNWYITCGDDDDLLYGNSLLHKIFWDRGISHQYRVNDGKHNWEYWRTYISEGLVFISVFLN